MTRNQDKEKGYAKKRKVFRGESTERSEFLALEWDNKKGILVGYKKARYLELKEKYGDKKE